MRALPSSSPPGRARAHFTRGYRACRARVYIHLLSLSLSRARMRSAMLPLSQLARRSFSLSLSCTRTRTHAHMTRRSLSLSPSLFLSLHLATQQDSLQCFRTVNTCRERLLAALWRLTVGTRHSRRVPRRCSLCDVRSTVRFGNFDLHRARCRAARGPTRTAE